MQYAPNADCVGALLVDPRLRGDDIAHRRLIIAVIPAQAGIQSVITFLLPAR